MRLYVLLRKPREGYRKDLTHPALARTESGSRYRPHSWNKVSKLCQRCAHNANSTVLPSIMLVVLLDWIRGRCEAPTNKGFGKNL